MHGSRRLVVVGSFKKCHAYSPLKEKVCRDIVIHACMHKEMVDRLFNFWRQSLLDGGVGKVNEYIEDLRWTFFVRILRILKSYLFIVHRVIKNHYNFFYLKSNINST